jgi:hypothetical protein
MNMQANEYLPAGESFPVHVLSRVLHVHRTHITSLIESGEIKCGFDIRGAQSSRSTIRVPRAAVVEFLERRKIVIVDPRSHGTKQTGP